MKTTKSLFTKIIVVLGVISIIYAIYASGFTAYLTFDSLVENREHVITWVEANVFLASLVYVAIYIVVAGFSIPGATILTLAGGLAFGAIFGTIMVNIGATLGAFFAFLLARFLLADWVEKTYATRLKRFIAEIETYGSNYLLTVRFIPIFPFFIVNILAGVLKNIKPRTFLWTTSVGIIAGSFVYAYAGSQLRYIDTLGDILSPGIISALALLGLFSLIPVVYKKVKRNNSKKVRK